MIASSRRVSKYRLWMTSAVRASSRWRIEVHVRFSYLLLADIVRQHFCGEEKAVMQLQVGSSQHETSGIGQRTTCHGVAWWFEISMVVFVTLLGPMSLLALEVGGLYQAETIVTGRGEAERQRGFRSGLEDVLIKLSGDADLVHAQGVQRILARASDFVERYEYEDRMRGLPIHDEQGTRDRPHYLRMTFRRAPVEESLRLLDVPLWPSDRPQVAIWLGISDSIRFYVLGSDTVFGHGQREVLQSVSQQRGIPIILPAMHSEAQPVITYDDLTAGNLRQLLVVSARYHADAILFGTLVMDDNGYWTLTWKLDRHGHVRPWQLAGVTFDVALRAALERAARVFATLNSAGQR